MWNLTGLMTLLLAVIVEQAQQPKPQTKPQPKPAASGPLPKLQAPAAAPAQPAQPLSAEEIERRDALFRSPRWKKIVERLQEWASIQQIYTPEQLEQIRQSYDRRLLSESPEQVEQTMGEMEQWLDVMLSPEARQANAYLAQTLALQSKQAAEKTRQKLPNVAFMTSAQVEQELLEFNQQRQADAATAAAFNRARQQQIQMTQASLAAQQRAQQQALEDAYRAAASRPAYQSPLSPPSPARRIDWGSSSPEIWVGNFGRTGVVFGGHRW